MIRTVIAAGLIGLPLLTAAPALGDDTPTPVPPDPATICSASNKAACAPNQLFSILLDQGVNNWAGMNIRAQYGWLQVMPQRVTQGWTQSMPQRIANAPNNWSQTLNQIPNNWNNTAQQAQNNWGNALNGGGGGGS